MFFRKLAGQADASRTLDHIMCFQHGLLGPQDVLQKRFAGFEEASARFGQVHLSRRSDEQLSRHPRFKVRDLQLTCDTDTLIWRAAPVKVPRSTTAMNSSMPSRGLIFAVWQQCLLK